MAISCIIITLNEAQHILDCIQSVQEIVDDVIVIDAESTDRTVSIAKGAGAKVIIRPWEGYSAAKNYGASLAKHDWILSIDADERISPALAISIKSAVLVDRHIYAFNRLNHYCGQWIRHGSWYPSWKPRLYHRKQAQWNNRIVHEQLDYQKAITLVRLNGDLLHYAYDNHEALVTRLSRYASLSKQEGDASLVKRYLSPPYHFLRSYIFRLGFLDGHAGWKIAIAQSVYTFEKYNPRIDE